MKALLAVLLFFIATANSVGIAVAEAPIPALRSAVTDLTGSLPPADINSLESSLREFSDRKGSQIAVLIVPSVAPESIEQYSLRVVEQWKLGRAKFNDGVLLIVAKNDRQLRIEVGYGLEGAVPDVMARRIIDEIITPRFREGDFPAGIRGGVSAIMKLIDGEALPPPPPRGTQNQIGPLFPAIFFAVVGISSFLRAVLGATLGAVISGVATAVVASFFLPFPIAIILGIAIFFLVLFMGIAGSRSGYYGNGSRNSWSSGGSGWSGGGGGGFSGGGGSFGGGGSSGRW